MQSKKKLTFFSLFVCRYLSSKYKNRFPRLFRRKEKKNKRPKLEQLLTMSITDCLNTQKLNGLMICFDLKHAAYLFRLCTIDFYLKRFDLMMPFHLPSAHQAHTLIIIIVYGRFFSFSLVLSLSNNVCDLRKVFTFIYWNEIDCYHGIFRKTN